MRIVSKQITWSPAMATDVVAQRVYYDSAPLDYNAPFIEVGSATNSVLVPDDFPVGSLTEGDYNIGVTALDAWGNESDMAQKTFFFDFTAPDAPADLQLVDL